MTWNGPLNKIDDYRFEIPDSYKGENNNLKMNTSALIYSSDEMISSIREDNAPEQAANVTSLPGIVGKGLAMPDIHWGYGFPIGGVAAVDADDGVISPGGIGFDINCLHGNAMVLHEHGYRMKIEDFEKNWKEDQIKCANFSREIKNTEINAFMKFKSKKKLLKTKTESGREIVATRDHPFYTKEGMKKLENIDIGEDVAIHPFDGVNYSQPSDDIIVSIEDIKNLPLKKDMTQTIKELKKRGLLPLRQNNKKLSFLLKLFGYILGDGTIYFTKNKGTIWFYGNKEDLEEIREDVRRIL